MAQILVVEDSPLIAKLLQMELERAGHSVLIAGDGSAALSAAASDRVDVILLDLLLPGADGFSVLAALKANPATAAIPVFMLTGQSDASSIEHGLERGAAAYLPKPVDMPDLLKSPPGRLASTRTGSASARLTRRAGCSVSPIR